MTADWPTLAAQARAALRWWDAWCPDDGRPLWALDVAEAYWRGRADATELQRARHAVTMASVTAMDLTHADAVRGRAWAVAHTVMLLIGALTDSDPGSWLVLATHYCQIADA